MIFLNYKIWIELLAVIAFPETLWITKQNILHIFRLQNVWSTSKTNASRLNNNNNNRNHYDNRNNYNNRNNYIHINDKSKNVPPVNGRVRFQLGPTRRTNCRRRAVANSRLALDCSTWILGNPSEYLILERIFFF